MMTQISPKRPATQATLPRISMKMLFRDFFAAFDLEKGLLYTLKALLLNPAQAISQYLFHDRSRLFAPFKFLLLSITPSTLVLMRTGAFVQQFSKGFEDGIRQEKSEVQEKPKPAIDSQKVVEVANDSFSLSYLLLLPILAWATWFPFRKSTLSFGEHLIIHAYLTGFFNWVLVLLLPVILLAGESFIFLLLGSYIVAYLIYLIWVLYKLFGFSLGSTLWRTLLFFMLGYLIGTFVYGIVLGIWFIAVL